MKIIEQTTIIWHAGFKIRKKNCKNSLGELLKWKLWRHQQSKIKSQETAGSGIKINSASKLSKHQTKLNMNSGMGYQQFMLQICGYLQYLLKIHLTMNFNPYGNYCYQFWMVPNMVSTATPYYAPVVVYPQLVQPRPNNLIINANYVDSHPNLTQVKEKIEAKNESKAAIDEVTHKSQNEKITVQIDSSISKQPSLKIEPKKAKRPQTYLTEKAFYMKQKLKGKQKGGARILRRRLKVKQIKNTRVIQTQKNLKKTVEQLKLEKKKLPIVKDSQKERKIVNKIKLKLLKQYRDEFAEIPKKISGVIELNEFCRTKLQNLLSRQVTTE